MERAGRAVALDRAPRVAELLELDPGPLVQQGRRLGEVQREFGPLHEDVDHVREATRAPEEGLEALVQAGPLLVGGQLRRRFDHRRGPSRIVEPLLEQLGALEAERNRVRVRAERLPPPIEQGRQPSCVVARPVQLRQSLVGVGPLRPLRDRLLEALGRARGVAALGAAAPHGHVGVRTEPGNGTHLGILSRTSS